MHPSTLMLRTADGQGIDVEGINEHTTAQHIIEWLHQYYHYPLTTRLMYSGKVLAPGTQMLPLPPASVIVVGKPQPPGAPPPPAAGSSAGRSPLPATSTRTSDAAPSPSRAGASSTTATPSAATTAPAAAAAAEPNVRIHVVVPSQNLTLVVRLFEDATCADLMTHLLAQQPRLVGSKLVAHGHVLSKPAVVLRNIGVKDDTTVFCAVGDVNACILQQMKHEADLMARNLREGRLTLAERKGNYELAMKMLFSLDDMIDMDPSLKPQRRALVTELQALQDAFNPTPPPAATASTDEAAAA